MRRVGTKGRHIDRAPTMCQSLSEAPMSSKEPTQQGESGVLASGSFCCPPATWQDQPQGVLIPGDRTVEETIPTASQGAATQFPNGGGRGCLTPPPGPAGCLGWGLHFSSMSQSPGIGDLGPDQYTAAGLRPADQEPEKMPWASLLGPRPRPLHGS